MVKILFRGFERVGTPKEVIWMNVFEGMDEVRGIRKGEVVTCPWYKYISKPYPFYM